MRVTGAVAAPAAGGPAGHVEVLDPGPLTLVQDRGRPGHAHLGVPRAGALDPAAAALAGRLVGNGPDDAVLEVLLGGLVLRWGPVGAWVAVTGAPVTLWVDGRVRSTGRAEWVPAGATLRLGPPPVGLRSWVAVAGGIAVDPVLGSRSRDTLAGVGPAPLAPGDVLPLGPRQAPPAPVVVPPGPAYDGALGVSAGPRADWLGRAGWERLLATPWRVGGGSDRVGLRLEGEPLARAREGELASEGVVLGAVQLPPDGRPVVFLADHPTTGGYPVVAVVVAEHVARCAQLRPGDPVRLVAR